MKNDFDFDVRKQFFRYSEILERLNAGGIIVPDSRWDVITAAKYVDSVLRNLPTQSFYLDGNQRIWNMLDGSKRFNALRDFQHDVFPLTVDLYDGAIAGLLHSEIKGHLRNRITDYKIEAFVINPGHDRESHKELINRLTLNDVQAS